jgi:hypothetical protein
MGAVFEGQCRYLQDPLRPDAAPAAAQIAPPAAQPAVEFGSQGESRLGQGVIVTGASS